MRARSVCGVVRPLQILFIIWPFVLGGFAFAADVKDMLGSWTWEKFTIEVGECADRKLCAKVVAGPKNIGIQIFASELTVKEGAWFGDLVNPATGVTYRTRMRFTEAGTWRLDGCTASRVCLSGEFVRAR
jgi:uncharacterized protein (DUF2147 family)